MGCLGLQSTGRHPVRIAVALGTAQTGADGGYDVRLVQLYDADNSDGPDHDFESPRRHGSDTGAEQVIEV